MEFLHLLAHLVTISLSLYLNWRFLYRHLVGLLLTMNDSKLIAHCCWHVEKACKGDERIFNWSIKYFTKEKIIFSFKITYNLSDSNIGVNVVNFDDLLLNWLLCNRGDASLFRLNVTTAIDWFRSMALFSPLSKWLLVDFGCNGMGHCVPIAMEVVALQWDFGQKLNNFCYIHLKTSFLTRVSESRLFPNQNWLKDIQITSHFLLP